MTDDLTPAQREVLDRLSDSPLAEQFYFTGGSALSAYYLHHRRSLDLDLFSRRPFDPKQVIRFLSSVTDEPLVPRRTQDRYEFTVPLRGERLRVEFVHYDFDPIADSGMRHGHLRVDSLRDMLANKLSAIVERTEGKDFADVYFLLQRDLPTLATGIADCHAKFGWPGLPHLLQLAFLRAERIAAWPETDPLLDPATVGAFFRDLSRQLIALDDT